MIKFFTMLLSLLFAFNTCSFEIKPICPPPQSGAYCKQANTSVIKYNEPSNKCENTITYATTGSNQPIHEAITRTAYLQAFGKPLTNYNYLQPLISGVEWNDDPRQLIRKALYNNGTSNIFKFAKLIDAKKPTTDITIRSHYGDMQFLHSMRPSGMESASPTQVKETIYNWIKASYHVATGEISYDSHISKTYFSKYFSENPRYNVVSDIFDPRKLHKSPNYSIAIQRLASGSILHIIQDSYSNAHTYRNPDTGKIENFYHYPNEHHCLSDTGSVDNKKNIGMAIKSSTEYMLLKDKGIKWCDGMALFIRNVLNMDEYTDISCAASQIR